MENKELKDHLRLEEDGEGVLFNHFSYCEMIKHIMVKYGKTTYPNADDKLKNSFLIKAPESYTAVCYITHELQYHWAMLLLHGDQYWLKGIACDYNDFKDEYLTWEAATRQKYQLEKAYQYYDF